MTTFNTEEIEIHIRTYRSLLKAGGKIKISQLIDSHINMDSILHEKAGSKEIDVASFIYVLLRLPICMSKVKNIILGQSYDVFHKHGFADIDSWQEATSPGRRRKMYFDGSGTLVVYIASVTDVDDLITLLSAFQIEWNKFHKALSNSANLESFTEKLINKDDLDKIKNIWGNDYPSFLRAIQKTKVDFTVQLLAGSYVEYAKATQAWWKNIVRMLPKLNLEDRPIYFISSNTHSIINLLTKFALKEEKILIDFLYQTKNANLIRLWEEIKSGDFLANKENFLCYIAKKYARHNPSFLKKKEENEKSLGIHTIPASHYLDIDAQIIEIKKFVKNSPSLIINIDYPLGWAAYQILTEIGQNVTEIRGVYIMGKAATLTGQIGDILVSDTVFDQHTKNIYVFDNAFQRRDFAQFFKTGMIHTHQKTVAAKGTFLENGNIIKKWFAQGYNIIEMESGPFLNAIYEFIYYNRYVENQFISLVNIPFEIGIANYASDTPYSKARNLGVRNLSYEGVEPTYAISSVILKKIIEKESR